MRPRVLKEAEEELREAMLYYEQQREGLGADFYECVNEAISAIAQEPLRFPVYEGRPLKREFRRARVARFPYIVIFEIQQNETIVIAVAHTSRSPDYWEHRAH